MHEGRRRAVLARLHEVVSGLAVRQHTLVRITGSRRVARFRRSRRRHRLRVCHEPDGNQPHGRSSRGGPERRTLLRACELARSSGGGGMSLIAIAYFAIAFALSWGGVLFVIGGPDAIPGNASEMDRLFPLAYIAMLAGPPIAGVLLT